MTSESGKTRRRYGSANDRFRRANSRRSMPAVGRNDSSARGGLRASNLQRRISGDESEGSAVATRPRLCENSLDAQFPGSSINTVRLEKEATCVVVRRPQLPSRGSWCGPDGRAGDRTGRAVHGDSGCGGSVVGSVLRVSALDHARRSPADRPGGPGVRAGLEQFTEPTSSKSGPLWGERPRNGAVRA
jgi:hypothetical protein